MTSLQSTRAHERLATQHKSRGRFLSESLVSRIPAARCSTHSADVVPPFTLRRNSAGDGIGIDVTYLAINLIKRRLRDAFGEEIAFEEKGQPADLGGPDN